MMATENVNLTFSITKKIAKNIAVMGNKTAVKRDCFECGESLRFCNSEYSLALFVCPCCGYKFYANLEEL
jgi:predicted RNA-binding Zn-ribbon protein involved in translation (DUF1610 family)